MTERKRRRRGGPRLRAAIISVLVVAVVASLVLTAWFSPLLSVREVRITGIDRIELTEVEQVLGEVDGTPLLRMDTTAAANRIAVMPRVARVRVRTDYPSTLRVEIVERVPVAFVDREDGPHLLDSDGIDFAVEVPPPWIPRIDPAPGAGPEQIAGAIAVVAGLPEPLGEQVETVAVDDRGAIEMFLREDRVLRWGDPEDSALKGEVAQAVLTRPGRVYDVTVPALPTVE